MSNCSEPLTVQAHRRVLERLVRGDVALDATVGNGRDTEVLARATGDTGRVYGFDVQRQAIATARELLSRAGLMRGVTLFEAGHERMGELLPADVKGRVKAAMFNLGYLPGNPHGPVTQTASTVAALNEVLSWMASPAVVTVLCYRGHKGGAVECHAVESWAAKLDGTRYVTEWVDAEVGSSKPSPRLLVVDLVR